ncbi:MAG: hypothetical protein IPK74_17300 [Deltaproteobacteria bacterium]|nr:hypothetical protein [Deltaproteobacteria bacterium]
MTSRTLCLTHLFTFALLLGACPSDDPGETGSADSSGGSADSGSTGECMPEMVSVDPPDESACGALPTDFVPGADDDYPACVTDNGEWTPVLEDPPGSAARVDAYEMMRSLLLGHTPTADDFLAARMQYALDEGLESRILRREDLHFPRIADADQDAGVDFDKQCTVGDNVSKYPDRCVGPAKISPLINESFAAGMTGEGDPNVHAARIDAAVLWFLFVSTYKESSSCVQLPEDCDAHRGYYDGATPRAMPRGLAAQIDAVSPMAHDAVEDGIMAIGCWRDLYPDALTWADFGAEGQQVFSSAHEQLDNGLWYAFARLVRDRLEKHPMACGSEADASWAWLQVAGPVLDPEATRRDAAAGATLGATWTNAAPAVADLEAAIAAIDAAFPCPQCDGCEVAITYGYD